jgi:hypothetical protein
VRSLPPSKPLTGPASPRRSVCAPGDDASIVPQTAYEKEAHHEPHTVLRPPLSSRGTFCPQLEALEGRDAPGSLLGTSPGPVNDPGDAESAREREREAAELAILASLPPSHHRGPTVTTSPVTEFVDRSIVRGESTLRRTDHGITMHLRASDVPAGVYTGWIAIFTPGVTGPTAAGRVAGHVVGRGGHLNFAVHLNEGEIISGHPVFPSGSLQDARRQEIHMVVRYHGPADPGRIHEQTHTFEPDRAFNFLITIHPAP